MVCPAGATLIPIKLCADDALWAAKPLEGLVAAWRARYAETAD